MNVVDSRLAGSSKGINEPKPSLTKGEKLKPQIQHPIYQHGMHIHKQNYWVHARQLKVVNCLLHDMHREIYLGCINFRLILISRIAGLGAEESCSTIQNVDIHGFWQ